MLRRAYGYFVDSTKSSANGSAKSGVSSNEAEPRLRHRLAYDFYSSLVFVVALTGFSSLKVLLILFINFKIGTSLPRTAIPVATWIFNIGILFANELGRGYHYSTIGDAIMPFYAAAPALGKFLDSYGGLMPRWEVLFKVTVLRMISFDFDHYWSLDRSRAGSPLEVCDAIVPRGTCTVLDHCLLTVSRRNNWIPQHFQRESGCLCLLRQLHSRHSGHMLPTYYIHRCISPGQS